MKLKLLLEGISNTVYYTTNIRSAYDILNLDTLMLDALPRIKLSKEERENFTHFFTVTRRVDIRDEDIKKGIVVLELDGDKLNNVYYNRPVKFELSSKLEDLVFSNNSRVEMFSRFIKGVHILYNSKCSPSIKLPFENIKMVKSKKYPMYIYKKESDFIMLRTERAERL